jgi:hypothetical protein
MTCSYIMMPASSWLPQLMPRKDVSASILSILKTYQIRVLSFTHSYRQTRHL